MTPEQLYLYLREKMQPNYEQKFGVNRTKDVMNISSLVSGTRSFVYHFRRGESEKVNPNFQKKLSLALLRGSGVHSLINLNFNDMDMHTVTWKLPYEWKDGTKNITLLGHYDNILPIETEHILCEFKTTEQTDIKKNGLLVRAKRQLGTYLTILKMKTGITYQGFIVIFTPKETHIIEVTPEEIRIGFEFVKRTAYEVAKELDIIPADLPSETPNNDSPASVVGNVP